MPTGIYKRKNEGIYKKCEICNKEFWACPYQINNKKYCSRKCYAISKIGKQLSGYHIKRMKQGILNSSNSGMKNKKHSKRTKQKMKNSAGLNEKNHSWKGDNAKYGAMHDWVVRQKGRASKYKCEHCGKQAYHWANKKHNYKRNLDDYIALCTSCHCKYDYKYNGKKGFNFIKKIF